jgi:hypothetical protein
MSVFERYRLQGEAVERAEQAEADRERLERIDAAEYGRMLREQVERAEIARQGYTSRELAEHNQRQAAEKREKIDQLERELRRLKGERDPDKPVARSASWQSETDGLLARARELDGNPFMRDQVARFDQRRAARESAIRRSRADELEDAIRRGDQATIARVCDEADIRVY